ncbi:Exopolyphosphatase-like protein [Elsinoe fawcettii]|nr:Exopolyphosphatase-like protein [Elsinoe fawcettii]
MALARTSLRGFLTHTRYHLQVAQQRRSPITFVIGNESADLDSISSAILYAYIATISPATSPAIHVPLLNIPKSDLSLRPELLAILPRANITPSHLLTLDDLGDLSTLPSRLPPSTTRWILVDHNALQGTLGQHYASSVAGVIDHHVDEGIVPSDATPRVIETCGSCSSLIIQDLRNKWDAWFLTVSFSGAANGQGDNLIEDGAFATLWDAQVAFLGLASVLIDTANLQDMNKTTERDRVAVEYLEAKVRMSAKVGRGYERERFFGEVTRAKEDLGGMGVRDVLRKDYKMWEEREGRLGTAAVVRSWGYLEEKAEGEEKGGLVEQCRAFAEEHGLEVLSVMTAYTGEGGGFERQLMVGAGREKGREVVERFRKIAVKELDLQEIQHGDEKGWRTFVWQQKNLAASRKQIAPLLRKAMSPK